MTRYEEEYYADIHRIANALEKIAKSLDEKKQQLKKEEESKEKVICPHCLSTNVQSLYGTINLDGSNNKIHYICENCQKEFDV